MCDDQPYALEVLDVVAPRQNGGFSQRDFIAVEKELLEYSVVRHQISGASVRVEFEENFLRAVQQEIRVQRHYHICEAFTLQFDELRVRFVRR